MTWIKQGVIFYLDDAPNRSNHVQVTTPYVFDDFIRVYYSCRNNGKSFIAYFDLSKDLKTILKVHEQPIFTHGKPGNFDADGVMPSCIIKNQDELWMYYVGWLELSGKAKYHNEIGLAVSKDGGETFERKFDGPIMGRSKDEPGMAIMPFVMYKNWYRMWYSTGAGLAFSDGNHEPTYSIKYAESLDGVMWNRLEQRAVQPTHVREASCRPAVIWDNDKYRMWFSYRGCDDYHGGKDSYRMGYAESKDGVTFERDDSAAGISLGGEWEFDSQMQCYPAIIEVNGQRIIFYNGNDFGQTGIGLAIWR